MYLCLRQSFEDGDGSFKQDSFVNWRCMDFVNLFNLDYVLTFAMEHIYTSRRSFLPIHHLPQETTTISKWYISAQRTFLHCMKLKKQDGWGGCGENGQFNVHESISLMIRLEGSPDDRRQARLRTRRGRRRAAPWCLRTHTWCAYIH